MKTTDPRKHEKKTPPDTDTAERKFPGDMSPEEFIGEKADWSEDVSQYARGNKKKKK